MNTSQQESPISGTQVPPVALIIFNRPDKTARVFDRIRQARPEKLFIIADGPRTEKESELCDATRAVTENVDWRCDVQRNYAPKNIGCNDRISSGISWVLGQVDRAIFLEDDSLPHPDFFRYCAELLEKYKDDERIMQITGDNFQQGNRNFVCAESYYFSVIPQIQGWATWRRAWKLYDPSMSAWPAFEQSGELETIFPDPAVRDYWTYKFRKFYSDPLTLWDAKWLFACVSHHGYSAVPKVNLVSNIGYGADATHKKTVTEGKANLPTYPLAFPLVHPGQVVQNANADAYEAKHYRGINLHLSQRVLWFVKSRFPGLYRLLKRSLASS